MNKTFISFLVLSFLITVKLFAQSYFWEIRQAGSSLGGPIDVDGNNTDIIYYGSGATIYVSTNRGESFSPLGTPIPASSQVKNIILNNSIPGTMLVAIESSSGGDKIVKTTNNGSTWTIVLNNLNFSYFGIPMTPDPSHPDTIYTMSNTSFYRSTDFGNSWAVISNNFGPNGAPCDIEVFPDTSIILVGDNGTGIYRSTDYGLTWQQTYATGGEIPTIAIDYNIPGSVWATKWSGGGGVLKSENYGLTWSLVPGSFSTSNMWGIAVHPDLPGYVFTGCYSCNNTWFTKDNGIGWRQVPISSTNYQIYIVDSMTVFAAQGDGFYKLRSPFFIPVELSSFDAQVSGMEVRLFWTTSTETNNLGFDIEESIDNNEFIKIGFVPGFGTSTQSHSYSFTRYDLTSGKYYFRLKQIDLDGNFEYSSTIEAELESPSIFALNQNYPNPFNPSTTISFDLPEESNVNLRIFNLAGEEVFSIKNKKYSSGSHSIVFSANSFPSGVYIYRIEGSTLNGITFSSGKKMVLMK
ncbi:MAG: T9SS type A sorting domain-containing protein [Ignavibacteriaceae bacterium]|nr:T9SS type A sorting domain-containing protein [Ignavibacteriaceae bacterium]